MMKTFTPYIFEELNLHTDDALILFTDGVSEAMNDQAQEFGEDRLEEVAVAHKRNSAGEILNGIKQEVQNFTKGNAQSDDITMIILKVR